MLQICKVRDFQSPSDFDFSILIKFIYYVMIAEYFTEYNRINMHEAEFLLCFIIDKQALTLTKP